MTPATQPPAGKHPQRCENNCDNYEPQAHDCKILNHMLTSYEFRWCEKMGCASHSSAPGQRIAEVIGKLEELHRDITTQDIDWEQTGGAIEDIIALLKEVQ